MSYFGEVKKIYNEKEITIRKDFLICYIICQRLSPIFSVYYLRKGVRPNTITLHMIISGIIGGILFAYPNIYIKFIGMLFMQIWHILDCSDGEVARKTKIFSKFGKDIDYLAHIINHPIFSIAMCLSILQLKLYNPIYVVALFSLNCILDLYYRSILKLFYIKELKEDRGQPQRVEHPIMKLIVVKIFEFFTLYPNFILFNSIFYFLFPKMIIYYSILNIVLTFLTNIKVTINYLKEIYYQ